MRSTLHDQLHLVPGAIAHVHARELRQISVVLEQIREALGLVQADLLRRRGKQIDPTKGRDGMTAEQVVRAFLVKQMNGFSYEQLAFHLADSSTYRAFCRIGIDEQAPTRSTLQRNIKRVEPDTWESINRSVAQYAAAVGIDAGDKVRTDCTVVKANIHDPTDSSLLRDCVRVLARLMSEARDDFGRTFSNHNVRAKRRAMGILNAKSTEQRLPLYVDLLRVTEKTVASSDRIAGELDQIEPVDLGEMLRAGALVVQMRHYGELAKRVISQTQRRVLGGESVPATDKLVSIFEPHTDIIVKDRRETLYGHKICLTSGASGLVSDVVIEAGNPCDSTLALKMIQRQRDIYGKAPRQATFDGGFSSRANLTSLKELGVDDVAFSKGRGLEITDMVKSSWVYRCLRNFRAGIEGTISFLKRVFGLDRCAWSGLRSFKAYVCGSVLACNLLLIARHQSQSSS
ncbi:MAG: ISNCY family transposase [Actinomycetota bacterium]|nr:ISNCY family transposase [Actinomycetota bacterium]